MCTPKGLTPYQSASLSTVGGCSALAGMIVGSVLIDVLVMKEDAVKNVALITIAVSALVNPICNTLPTLMVSNVVFGFGLGAVDVAVGSFTKTVVGTEKLVQGIALVNAVHTVAQLSSSSLTGRPISDDDIPRH